MKFRSHRKERSRADTLRGLVSKLRESKVKDPWEVLAGVMGLRPIRADPCWCDECVSYHNRYYAERVDGTFHVFEWDDLY